MSKKGSLFHQFFGSKLSYLEKILEAVLKQEELLPYSGKAVWSMSLRQTLVRQSRTLITSDEYMVCLDSSEQIFDLLVQHEDMGSCWHLKSDRMKPLKADLELSNSWALHSPFLQLNMIWGPTQRNFNQWTFFWRASAIWRYFAIYPWAWNIRWHACQMESICWNEDGCLLNAGKTYYDFTNWHQQMEITRWWRIKHDRFMPSQ